ncbi:MAG: bifunctional oligoribonuclease/PAP phosphatase NrnA [Mycoplasmataceae bacterium]|nr:bifunctional oligoribonuclease/PAP phosphatase NrnA [Mycoplasmataceae bacterium]
MGNKLDRIIESIKDYNKISLFFHIYPDGDALGSVFALREFIRHKYPHKIVNIIGLDSLEKKYLEKFIPSRLDKQPSDEWIKKSMGIICDTANSDRVYTQKHLLCERTISIDHHPNSEEYAFLCWNDKNYSSCCEMIGEILFYWNKKYISNVVAQYIYFGIVTDTNRFFYSNTLSSTFTLVSKLYKVMDNPTPILQKLNERSLNDIKFEEYIYSLINFNTKKHVASLLIPKLMFKKYKVEASSMIWTMANVKDINIWTSLYYDTTTRVWKCSIRSKKIDVRPVAQMFNGGGHKNACGLILKSETEFTNVISELEKISL